MQERPSAPSQNLYIWGTLFAQSCSQLPRRSGYCGNVGACCVRRAGARFVAGVGEADPVSGVGTGAAAWKRNRELGTYLSISVE